MIVISLITLLTGVIGYNMRGTLEKGKAFKTEQAKEQLRDMLLLAMAEGNYTPAQLKTDTVKCLKALGLVKNPDQLVKDGWGQNFEITYIDDERDFQIKSQAYSTYKRKNKPAKQQ